MDQGRTGAQREWVLADSGKYYVPAYVGPTGWIGAWLDVTVDWPAIAELIVEGYLIQCGPKAAATHDPQALAAGIRAERPSGHADGGEGRDGDEHEGDEAGDGDGD